MKRIGIALFVTLSFLTLATTAWAEEESSCGQAAAWVADHAGELPSTYDELAAYPPSLRRAIFAALPAETKSRLWREHLERWVEGHPGLEASAQAVIAEAMDLLASDMFAVMDDAEKRQAYVDRLHGFEAKALGVMTPAELRGAFVDLGSFRTAAVVGEPIIKELPECDCALGEPGTVQECPRGKTCKDGGCKNDSGAGCGLFHYVPCHGRCLATGDVTPIEGP